MNPRQKLSKLGLEPKEGQNFLIHEPTITALVKAGEVEDHRTLEIGGGLGAITENLQKKTDTLTVIEKDSGLANHLEKEFPEIEVKQEDVLESDISDFERCVSNIPFNLSSEIITMLAENQVQSALIVQEDLADKVVSDPGDSNYGHFSALMDYYYLPVKLRTVNSTAFYPSPEVNAAIIKLYPGKDRHGIEDEEFFLSTIKALFTHKRKKLRNALVDSRNMLELKKDEIKEVRDEAPHSEERVVNLDVKKLSEVSEWLQSEF